MQRQSILSSVALGCLGQAKFNRDVVKNSLPTNHILFVSLALDPARVNLRCIVILQSIPLSTCLKSPRPAAELSVARSWWSFGICAERLPCPRLLVFIWKDSRSTGYGRSKKPRFLLAEMDTHGLQPHPTPSRGGAEGTFLPPNSR